MQTPGVGEDIESHCSPCGGLMWHVVVAKVGEKIAKVQCKRCHVSHRLRSTDPINAKVAKVREVGEKAPKKAPRPRQTQLPPPRALPEVAFDPNIPPRTYKASETFDVGQRVEHPKFGVGVIVKSHADGKIEARFDDEVRVLAQAKKALQLIRQVNTNGEIIFTGTADAPPKR